jgi:hypothetical protein
VIRVDSSVARDSRKAGGIPAIDAVRIFYLETSVFNRSLSRTRPARSTL